MGGASGATPGGIGVVLLRDTRPGEALGDGAALRAIQRPSAGADAVPEPRAPKAFEWTLDDYMP
jgi:hypothetical protein